MQLLLKLVSLLGLGLVTVPGVLYFTNHVTHATVISTALVGTILWFASTPFWMGSDASADADQVEI